MSTEHPHESRTTHDLHRGSGRLLSPWLTGLLTGLLSACGPAQGGKTEEPAPAPRCEASTVRCTEQSIDNLDLLTVVSTGDIHEEGTVSGEFLSYVDARAGGVTPTQSYTYVRFSDAGLSRVSVDDQAALASTDWDIALRRYVIRVNSGVSGPSCTAVARTPAGTSFDSVKAVDASWAFHTESYFNDACELVTDESGIGAPASQLADFWTYKSCLAMSGNVYVVRLADGRHVKLQVTSYYDTAPQQVCNDTGKVPSPSGSGQIRVKWAFLP